MGIINELSVPRLLINKAIAVLFLSILTLPQSASGLFPFGADRHLKIITGQNIINTPNHNSSSGIPNMPFIEIPKDKLVKIGHFCELDSECGNYSVCRLKVMEDENTVKLCECDSKEMKRVNQACYMKPGHQCYFPAKNSHGYRYVECLPGSSCIKSVNRSEPNNGYCMCDVPELERRHRDLNVRYEMARCAGSTIIKSFVGLLISIQLQVIM